MAPTFDPTDDDEATIAAKALKVMDRKGFYDPRKVRLDHLPAMTPVATHDEAKVAPVVEEMIGDDSYPVVWDRHGATVMLKQDSQRWTAASIARLDRDVLEWDQERRLE